MATQNGFEWRSLLSQARSPAAPAKYAALTYYPVHHNNLGDEIQTLAALRFLPRVDAWAHRERLDEFAPDEPHKIILNGWFLDCPEHWPPSPLLRPLVTSFHLTHEIVGKFNPARTAPAATVLQNPAGLAFLERHQPIGARDLDTLAQLQAAGLQAYFSGCLTLTFEPPSIDEERRVVYAVDVPDAVFSQLAATCDGPLVRLSHHDIETVGDDRLQRAAELLRGYANAKAVVTCRLHCALPCLAFETPVLFIENAADSYRFDGLRDLLHHATVAEVLEGRCDFVLRSPPPNGDAWRPLRDGLIARCTAFVGDRISPAPEPPVAAAVDRGAAMQLDDEAERNNSSRVYLRRAVADFAAGLPDGARVLDAGGGGTPLYRPLFARQRYETADLRAGATHVCDLHALPLADQSFDAALSTQTLYIVREPRIVLSELHRVLKPGAPLLLTAPLMYEEEPVDFYRFTSVGLRDLVETAGFRIVEIGWLEGFFGSLGYLLRAASEQLARLDTGPYSPVDRRIVRKATSDLALFGQAFNEMDLRHKETSAGFPLNYVVRAHKA